MTRAALANYKVDYIGVGKSLTEEERIDGQAGRERMQDKISHNINNNQAIQGPESSSGAGRAGFTPSVPASVEDIDVALTDSASRASSFRRLFPSAKGILDGGGTGVLEKAGFMSLFGNAGGRQGEEQGRCGGERRR